MYDASGNEKYIYPTTDAIQKLDSSKAIADYFTYTDRYGDTKKPITEQFGQFDIEVQKEAAEGIQWAMESYKLDTLPDIITRGKVSSGAVAEYTYSHNLDGSPVHSVTFRPSTKANEAYTTAVHEMTHYVDHTYHDVSRSVCEQARKNLKLRLRTKDYDNLAYRIAESDSDDPAELLAYSMEMHIMKKGNKLSEEIVRLFFERINK